jgi:hypothetical protein
MTDLTIEQHLSNLGAFIDDADYFELADDSTVDITEACAAFHAISAEIARLRAELAAARQDAERMRNALRPFVEFISAYPRPRISVSAEDTIMMSTKHGKLTLAHFDEARAALHGATPSLGSPD